MQFPHLPYDQLRRKRKKEATEKAQEILQALECWGILLHASRVRLGVARLMWEKLEVSASQEFGEETRQASL